MLAAATSTGNPPASDDRGSLAKMVMVLLDHWKLTTEDQAALLGIASSNRAALSRYRKGDPIGTNRDQYERVGHLLGIHKNLRLLFPQNRDLAYCCGPLIALAVSTIVASGFSPETRMDKGFPVCLA